MLENGWINYTAAFAVFFASHMVLVRPPVRPVLVRFLTPRGFSAAYSLLSLAILWWMIEAAQAAPYVELWSWEPWQNWVPIIAMLPACLIAAFGVAVPNPFSFGGAHNERFDPQRPGIVRWMRHPILVALFLWSIAHLVPNGNLAHAILFGAFAIFSLLGMKLIDRRRKREMGEDWSRQLNAARAAHLTQLSNPGGTLIRLLVGLFAYVGLAHLHPYFAGVYPFA
ncbi:NnrU family protein [Roseibium album]|uniref:Putative membrane protein n=1 Tax=Roseibium album TaxID=311410 RepID=A0A0M7B2F1_9HYPH|nr:NnrU family protein [Roseibium album]CTQ63354.1 putative membrane protein [Roseibium album]CTQ69791.1 putative membrane protein [Roseibium album]CTQ80941.1 putative membrane protein [Roseibium album]